ncbi:MAG: helix-turn-helix transcriptional regulator [Phenylobacterium sp.]|uniref:helix-turn-helix domain-containing protein n=1 Tax=Phenylobacterium sp. TaxID=1871053 RepID=UPI0027206F29|nr:helix-turn-helix transcriptional regulator [Phenylobacterium sp.]MDO8913965.1 helix-turn-helix transcriptional regulator [Phenylobacterium sp.]MDP3100352.1 helix-turn-helix transcriptional regulator [Phenylobacterium sp.]
MMLLSPKTLSAALKSVRRHRRLTVQQVADRMGLAKRTYEYFESDKGGLRLDHLDAFAEATDSDARAILVAALSGAPDFASACADTKAMAILFSTVARVEPYFTSALAHLTTRDLAGVFSAAFADLIGTGQERRDQTAPTTVTPQTQCPDDPPPSPPQPPDPDRSRS